MSGVTYYRDLLRQTARNAAFREAIRRTVRSGDRVLDVGTGIGTFACFAAQSGAAVVWAVDPDPIVHVAQAIARWNGLGDRVRCVRGQVPDVELPERADLVLFEDFPPRLLDARTARVLEAVRTRYAAPGARFVPDRAVLYAAPVSAPEVAASLAPFGPDEAAYGLDWRPSREYVANTPLALSLAQRALATAPARLGEVRLAVPVDAGALGGEAVWRLEQGATIHGLAYWFDLVLADEVVLSNAPGAEPGSWGHLLLPVDPPLPVAAGTDLVARVGPEALPDGAPGWLAWELVTGAARRRGHEFAAYPAALDDLLAASPDGVPRLDADAALEARVLALVDGRRSVREIADAVRGESAATDWAAAGRVVARVLRGRIRVTDGIRPRGRAPAGSDGNGGKGGDRP